MARKALLIILLLLLGVVLGVPYYFGTKLEALHAQEVAKANTQPDLEYQTLGYSRGWLKSEARDRVRGCSAAGQCVEIEIDTVMHHGPIAITGIMAGVAPMRPVQGVGVARVGLDKLVEGAALKPALPALTVSSVVELDSTYQAVLEMPASQHTVDGKSGQLKLMLGGLSGNFSGTAGSGRAQGEIRFPSLRLEDQAGMAFALNNVSVSVDGESTEAGFIGTVTEKLGSLAMSAAADDPQPFALENLTLTVKGGRSNDGLSQTQFNGEIRIIKATGRQYGPATLEGEMLRVNRAAMTRMQTELETLGKQNKPPQDMLPAMMAIYQKGIPEVLKSRPELNLKSLNIRTPEGDLLASLKLVGVPPQGELQMGAWLNLVQAELDLQVPAVTLWNILDAQLQQAAHQAAAQSGQPAVLPSQDAIGAKVTELVNSNVLVPKLDANAYTLQVALLEGRLLINGQENQAFADLGRLLGGQKPGAMPPGMDMQVPAPAP
jgi:uncharacterized protein YdgA (DUF945 family)